MTDDQMERRAENAVADGCCSTAAVAALLGVSESDPQLFVALQTLQEQGRIRSVDGGWERVRREVKS